MLLRVVNGGQSHEFEQENLEDCSFSQLQNRIKERFSSLPYIYTLNYLARDKEPLRLNNQSDYEKLFELVRKQMNDNPLARLKNEKKVIKLIVFAKNTEQKGEDTTIMGTKEIKTITQKLENMMLIGEQQKNDGNNKYEDEKQLDLDKICEKVKNLKLLQEKNQVKEIQSSSDGIDQEGEKQKVLPKKKKFAEDAGNKNQSSDSDEDEDDDPSKPIHHGVQCDHCDRYPIKGVRWKCSICPNYDLCENCQFMDIHTAVHPLLKIKVPISFNPQNGPSTSSKKGKLSKFEKKQNKRKQKQKLKDDLMSNEALQILVISRASALSDILLTEYEKCFKLVLKHPMKSQSQLIDIYFQKFKNVHT